MSVFSSALFGTISGSGVANVMVDGVFTIPMMKRIGFGATFAAAVEATASIGGQIMPPIMAAAAFIMADFVGVPFRQVALAAVIPALLYFFCVYVTVHFEARRLGLRQDPARGDAEPAGDAPEGRLSAAADRRPHLVPLPGLHARRRPVSWPLPPPSW